MSSVPNNERPWAPAELDAIEDALEHLDAPRLAATLSAEQAERIGGRLASYRAIESLSRELLTSYAAPASAIAAAMAEARAAATVPAAASEIPTVTPPWWSRARRLWLVPALASAGVGAVVVALSISPDASAPSVVASNDPRSDAKREQAPVSELEKRRDAPPSSGLAMSEPAALPPAEASDGIVLRGAAAQPAEEARGRLRARGEESADKHKDIAEGDATTKRDDADELGNDERKTAARRAKEEPLAPPASTRPAADPKPEAPKSPSKGAPTPKPSKPSTGGAPGSGSVDEQSPAALTDLLVRADRARRSGDCAAARRDYDLVMSRGDGKQRARAKAGTALCLERSGAQASAADMLAGARLDDPAIDAWLASERARGE